MSRSADFDVVVIGAGAAGVGAGRALAEAGSRFVVLEARDRIGGRAWTVDSGRGHPIDLGCEWLHSADINPLVPLAREVGVEVDEHAAVWASKWIEAQLGAAAYADYRAAVEALYDGAAALAEADGPDVPWSDFLEPGSRWRAPLDAVCGWITGVRLDQVSAVDAGRNQETMVNWRLPGGYGARWWIDRDHAIRPPRSRHQNRLGSRSSPPSDTNCDVSGHPSRVSRDIVHVFATGLAAPEHQVCHAAGARHGLEVEPVEQFVGGRP
jgi:monoamine oxidase